MKHEPDLAARAWRIASKHVAHFDTIYTPAREAILAAIAEALQEPPPPSPEIDTLIVAIDRAEARQRLGLTTSPSK